MQGSFIEVERSYRISESNPSRRLIAAVIVGNGLAWFDYISYSFLAVVFAKLFFPDSDGVGSLLHQLDPSQCWIVDPVKCKPWVLFDHAA
jgi:hypothetical protein